MFSTNFGTGGNLFGGTSGAPSFGTPSSSTAFTFTGASQPTFGATTTTPSFGATSASPGFTFGATQQKPDAPIFGSAQPQAPSFSIGSNLFSGTTGGQSTSTMFGGGSTFGYGAGKRGTGDPKYAPSTHRYDGQAFVHHNICSLEPYAHKSFEELRCEDYAEGRRGSAAAGGAMFGQTASATGSLFGGTSSAFGSTGQTAQSSPFSFGSTTGSGLFGGTSGGTSSGLFGGTGGTTFSTGSTTSGLFGGATTTTFGTPSSTGTTFGTGGSSLFGGAGGTTGTTSGLFGGGGGGGFTFGASSAPSSTSGLFGGSSAAPSTSLFGGTSAGGGNSLFGGTGGTTGSSLFGGSSGSSLFGGTSGTASSGLFGGTGGSSLFGGGGTGGASTSSLFGGTGSTGGGFTFGTGGSTGSGLFGGTSGGLFGGTGGGGLFGGASGGSASSGLFGSTPSSSTGTSGGGFNFGGMFGGSGTGSGTSSGLFGGLGGGGSSLFGGTSSGLFGGTSSSLFGGTSGATSGLTGQPLVATIDSNPYGTLPNLVPSEFIGEGKGTSSALPSSLSPAKGLTPRKTPRAQPHYKLTPRSSIKVVPRGYGPRLPSVFDEEDRPSSSASSPYYPSSAPGKQGGVTPDLFRSRLKLVIDPDTEVPEVPPPSASSRPSSSAAPSRRGGPSTPYVPPRAVPSVQITSSDGATTEEVAGARTPPPDHRGPSSPPGAERGDSSPPEVVKPTPTRPQRGGSVMDPYAGSSLAGSVAPHRSPSSSAPGSPSAGGLSPRGRPYAAEQSNGEHDAARQQRSGPPIVMNPDYELVPSIDELRRMTDSELSRVRNFAVECKGLGKVTFLGETDVRGLRINDIVKFSPRQIEVYPNEDEKPPVGKGLNRPARVTLYKCWPKNPKTKEYIKTESRRMNRHMMKLKSIPTTRFINYHLPTGEWTFEVDSF